VRRENLKPTRTEWGRITSRRPVMRRIPKPEPDEEKLERIAAEELEGRLKDEEAFRRSVGNSDPSAQGKGGAA
jgi:hypothetical protein